VRSTIYDTLQRYSNYSSLPLFQQEVADINAAGGPPVTLNDVLGQALRIRTGAETLPLQAVVTKGQANFSVLENALGERVGADYKGLEFISSLDQTEAKVFNIIRAFYGFGEENVKTGYTGYARTAADYQAFENSIKYYPSFVNSVMAKIDRKLGSPQNFFYKDAFGRQAVLQKVLYGIPAGQPGYVNKTFYYTPRELARTTY
jgi:hypothetical protein